MHENLAQRYFDEELLSPDAMADVANATRVQVEMEGQ